MSLYKAKPGAVRSEATTQTGEMLNVNLAHRILLKLPQYMTRKRRLKSTISGRFTLVEMMVSMTILSIMILMMFQFMIASQKTLAWSDRTWRVYENSRVVFDLLERDLQSTLFDDTPGMEVGMYIGDPDPTDSTAALHICFVSAADPDDNATSQLCEISYKHHSDTSASDPYDLTRQLTSNADTTNWNFYGMPSNWYINSDSDPNLAYFEQIVGGIETFAIVCRDGSGNVISSDTEISEGPTQIEITMGIFDENLVDAPEEIRNQTMREFTKIIFLGHGVE